MIRKILIMGFPGAGKTTLARIVAARLNAVLFNADDVRSNISEDLGFAEADRVEHARRMGWLCDQVTKTGGLAIADFICPTPAARSAFLAGGDAIIIWVNRIAQGPYPDTNRMFVAPERRNIEVLPEGTPEHWAERICQLVRPVFDHKKPTALFIGRYQPFHEGHKALICEGLRRVGQVCVAVRDTEGIDASNPFNFEYVRSRIEHGLREYEGRYVILALPNITHVFYGRDVGYALERIDLDRNVENISATQLRQLQQSPEESTRPTSQRGS